MGKITPQPDSIRCVEVHKHFGRCRKITGHDASHQSVEGALFRDTGCGLVCSICNGQDHLWPDCYNKLTP